MFTPPYIGSQLARERQCEMLAQADQQHLGRQLRDLARASWRAGGTDRRQRRALRCGCAHKPAHDITAGQRRAACPGPPRPASPQPGSADRLPRLGPGLRGVAPAWP